MFKLKGQQTLPKRKPKPKAVNDETLTNASPDINPVVSLQTTIGNRAVQRLIGKQEQAHSQQDNPIPFVQRNTANEGEAMEFEPMVIESNPDFLPRAKRLNMRYASNPPQAGWPYRDDLKALWEAGEYDEFTFRVQEFQINVMGIPYDSKEADGVIGKNTAAAMVANSATDTKTEAIEEPATTDTATAPTESVPAAETIPTNTADASPTSTTAPTQQLTNITEILAPVKAIYQQHEKLNKSLRVSYASLSGLDDKIAATRWNIIQLTWLTEHVPELEKKIADLDKELLDGNLPKKEAGKKRGELSKLKKNLEESQSKQKKLKEANEKSSFEGDLKKLKEERENKTPKKADKPTIASYRERNPERVTLEQQLVEAIKTARGQIDALPNADLKKTAYLELNNYTPYHYQGENIDILYNSGDAGGRTCNVTSTSMVLQSLGKKVSDYNKSDKTRMNKIALHFSDVIQDRGLEVDVAKLTMPDFLQLVAVDLQLDGAEPTGDAVSKARFQAADAILQTSFLKKIAESFGATATNVSTSLDDKLTIFGQVTTEAGNRSDTEGDRKADKQQEKAGEYITTITTYEQVIAAIGEINKQVTAETTPAQYATLLQPLIELINQKVKDIPAKKDSADAAKTAKSMLEKLSKTLEKSAGKMTSDEKKAASHMSAAKDALSGIVAKIEKQDVYKDSAVYKATGSYADMDKFMPLENYKASFLPDVTSTMNAGNQVVLNLYNHFVRLQSLEVDGFVIDDPGRWNSESLKVTWEQGRADGYFRKYMKVKS